MKKVLRDWRFFTCFALRFLVFLLTLRHWSWDTMTAVKDQRQQPLILKMNPTTSLTVNWKFLKLLVAGMSYKLIADRCFVSIDTISTHVKNIYRKLQVHSKGEAVAKAIKGRIV